MKHVMPWLLIITIAILAVFIAIAIQESFLENRQNELLLPLRSAARKVETLKNRINDLRVAQVEAHRRMEEAQKRIDKLTEARDEGEGATRELSAAQADLVAAKADYTSAVNAEIKALGEYERALDASTTAEAMLIEAEIKYQELLRGEKK